ncbi:MAG TPA: methylated-DNA--[protein]-cysteine S-methyltransferase [Gemmataceae bacterium]|nr:methylated-DNA--[protein]-cysteine S-methyltransferase [Gemmataceae bacterium]
MSIRYTFADSASGRLLLAATERGIAAVIFGENDAQLEKWLRSEFGAKSFERDDEGLRKLVAPVLDAVAGKRSPTDLPLDPRGTKFQQQVWKALQKIPAGQTRSYSQIAESIGRPKAVRAVARACATNPISVIVPCHRVIRRDGSLGGYAGGLERKKELLAREMAMV